MIKYAKNKENLFVDGYNIINHWENLKRISQTSLEDARDALMEIMAEYSAFTGVNLILVFDGYMVKKSPGLEFDFKGITVVFTKEFETADHFIEREIEAIGRNISVTVATSDNIEQQMILARGGKRISARELKIEVENRSTDIERTQRVLKNENFPTIEDSFIETLEKLREDIN